MPSPTPTAAVAVVALAISGCGGLQVQERIVPPSSVGAAVQRATGVRVVEQPLPDRPSLVNLLATFSGERGHRDVTVLVFDGRLATRQAVGAGAAGSPDPSTRAIRDRNLVVFYRGDRAAGRRLARELAALRGVPEEGVPPPVPVPNP
jgi:hypothetical protein